MMNADWEAGIGKAGTYLYKLVHVPGKVSEFDRQPKSAMKRAVREKKRLELALQDDPAVSTFTKALTHVYGPRCIARGEDAQDPWRRELKLVKAKLVEQYLRLEYPEEEHRRVNEAGDTTQISPERPLRRSQSCLEWEGRETSDARA